MEKTVSKIKEKSKKVFFYVFLAASLLFLALGMGTLGSFSQTGRDYELLATAGNAGDNDGSYVVFRLEDDLAGSKDGEKVKLKQVLVSIAALYGNGEDTTIRIERSMDPNSRYSATAARTTLKNAEWKENTFRWVEIDIPSDDGWTLSNYCYHRLSSTANVRINEIVFKGEITSGERAGQPALVDATVQSATLMREETEQEALRRASALLDRQSLPSPSQSSFHCFADEEKPVLASLSEIRAGNRYIADGDGMVNNVYRGETAYGALGLDFLALGVSVFGMSPFGLRFFPMLASFGIFLVGSLFVRRLARSDRAAYAFAALYAACDLSFSLGHLGTPLTIGVFFFVCSLSLCHKFYADGIKKVGFAGMSPLLFSGVLGAAAVCVHGAFLIPMAGVCALFACGIVRQFAARRHYLDEAIAAAELPSASEEEREQARGHVSAVVAEYRYKNVAALVAFPAAFLLGMLVFSLVAMLPAYYVFMRLYDRPVSPRLNVFVYAWKSFAGGFSGASAVTWNWFYTLFTGTGSAYAVTGAVMNPAAALAGVFGIGYAAYRIAVALIAVGKKEFGKEERKSLRRTLVPFAGLALSLVTAAFAPAGVGFLFLAYLFSFALAAEGYSHLFSRGEKEGKGAFISSIAVGALLIVFFALFFVFTFSIPMSAGFMTKLF